MTIIDHPDAAARPSGASLDHVDGPEDHAPPAAVGGDDRRTAPFPLSGPGRVLLAALSFGAGAVHLAMAPSHASSWLAEGITFAAAGLVQIVLGAVLLARPTRLALRATCWVNAAFILAWTVTRVAGMPFGPEAGSSHPASFVDVACVALEAALVLVGYELLARPDRGSRMSQGTRVLLSVVPVGILVLATAAVTSPSAAGHAHGAGEEAHGIAAGTEGHAGVVGGHDHGAAPVDDKGLSKVMNGQGEGGGHSHGGGEPIELDGPTQAALDEQLALTRPLIEKYPNVAAAEADGYRRSGPYAPGLGAHYTSRRSQTSAVNADGRMDPEDLAAPTLIFDGVRPGSPLAGFMYNVFSTDLVYPPDGFAGPNDHWHYHTNVCIVPRSDGGIDSPLGADASVSKETCDQFEGGRLLQNTGYMVHVWTVPGYDSPEGVFSNVNSKMSCADGTYYVIPLEEIGTKETACRDGSAGRA